MGKKIGVVLYGHMGKPSDWIESFKKTYGGYVDDVAIYVESFYDSYVEHQITHFTNEAEIYKLFEPFQVKAVRLEWRDEVIDRITSELLKFRPENTDVDGYVEECANIYKLGKGVQLITEFLETHEVVVCTMPNILYENPVPELVARKKKVVLTSEDKMSWLMGSQNAMSLLGKAISFVPRVGEIIRQTNVFLARDVVLYYLLVNSGFKTEVGFWGKLLETPFQVLDLSLFKEE